MFRFSLNSKSLILFRFCRFSSTNSLKSNYFTREQIFYNLINQHNRKRSIPIDLLKSAIKNIHSRISQRLSAVILSSAARSAQNTTSEKRLELLEEAWKNFDKQRVRLTTRHYEIFLSGLNENGLTFDPEFYFDQINRKNIPLTPFLYNLILKQFCRNGQVEQAEQFLRRFSPGQMKIDENVASSLIVARIQSEKFDEAELFMKKLDELDRKPTISTYKDILVALIQKHRFEIFENYFRQIDKFKENAEPFSTLYVDGQLICQLLQECLFVENRSVFEFLLEKLRHLQIESFSEELSKLVNQCLEVGWHQSVVEILELISQNEPMTNNKNWISLFKQILSKYDENLVEIYLQISVKKNLLALDVLLLQLFGRNNENLSKILKFIEFAASLGHPMRQNYFYPILVRIFSSKNDENQNEEIFRCFSLIEKYSIVIEPSVYTRILQSSFHQFYKNEFSSFLEFLSKQKFETNLDRFSRFLLNDVRHRTLNENVLLQISPYFRLDKRTRREEFARNLFSVTAGTNSTSTEDFQENLQDLVVVKPPIDCHSLFRLIESICQQNEKEIPGLKREIYFHLLQIASENQRHDLSDLFAQQSVKENIVFENCSDEFHSKNRIQIDQEIFEKIFPNLSEKTMKIDDEQRSLRTAIKRRSINESFLILRQIEKNQKKVDPSIIEELFRLVDPSIEKGNFDFLVEFYSKTFGLSNLPIDFIFDLSKICLSNGDEIRSIEFIREKANSKMNDQFVEKLTKFVEKNASIFSVDAIFSIGKIFLPFRVNESNRKLWRILFKAVLDRTSSTKVVDFFSKSVKENGKIPYLDLFEFFIVKGDLNNLQKIVDVASNQHGFQNVSHDLAFTLIQHGKFREAQRIFEIPSFRVRNDRIHLHSLRFAEAKNLDGLIEAIKLTKNLSSIDQRTLFIAAIQVAVKLDQTEKIDWLIEQIEKNQIQLDDRHKKFVNAHSMSKGLNRKFVQRTTNSTNEQNLIFERNVANV